MMRMKQPKPKPGETWKYLTGQYFEILEVNVDPASGKEVVVYREDTTPKPLWRLEMDDFMATLSQENNTTIPFFCKA